MNLKNRIIALVAATAVSVPAVALARHSMKAGKDKTPMAFFSAKLTGGASIDGKTADITLSDDDSTVTIKVNMKRVNTGMDLRNEHFQTKFLKGKTEAKLSVKKADVKGNKGDIKGQLTLNGHAPREVTVHYKKDDDGDRLKVKGNFDIKYTDFGWEKMCYLGVCVNEDVKVSADLWVSKD
jgi:polyisoprenoid-binding protein YceI